MVRHARQNGELRVQSLGRALRLLDALQAGPRSVPDLCVQAGMPRSTAFRLLGDLETAGYVRREAPGSFALSLKLVALGASVLDQMHIRDFANPVLTRLAKTTKRTAHVSVREGLDAVVVARVESSNALKLSVPLGRRGALYAGAAAKILLAYAPDDVIADVLRAPMPRLASRTPTSAAEVRAHIAQVRATGWVVTLSEVHEGAYSIAAPIRDGSGQVVAAIALGGIEVKPRAHQEDLRAQILRAAASISSQLGYRAPGARAAWRTSRGTTQRAASDSRPSTARSSSRSRLARARRG